MTIGARKADPPPDVIFGGMGIVPEHAVIEHDAESDADDTLTHQAFVQDHVADDAVSFTGNIREGHDGQELARTLIRWLHRLKGTTGMVDGTRPQAPFERITRQTYEMAAAPAVGQAMDLLEAYEGQVWFIIQTDREENSSQHVTRKALLDQRAETKESDGQ